MRGFAGFMAAAVIGLAGCGGQHRVWSVKAGVTQHEVRARLGAPNSTFRGGRLTCWSYAATKKGTSIEARNFCFRAGRVALIGTGNHL